MRSKFMDSKHILQCIFLILHQSLIKLIFNRLTNLKAHNSRTYIYFVVHRNWIHPNSLAISKACNP